MKLSSPSRPPQYVLASGTAQINLTLAIGDYEHVRDVTYGVVQPQGITLTPLVLPIEEIAFRQLKNFEFDIAETSFAKYISMVGAGDASIVGIPVYPARLFRHSAIYVRKDSGIRDAKGLEGRVVGIPEWAQTAGVYLRGLLSEYYGVALERIHWVQASVNEPGRAEKVKLKLPSTIHYESRPDKCLSDMLLSGEIDAALTARAPNSFLHGEKSVVRLFPDFRVEEEAYYQATGIFPIMHIVTLRRSLCEAYPWVAANMQKAFEHAKDAAIERLREMTTSRIPLPWGAVTAEQLSRQMGGDPWPYGVSANLKTLDAFCRFAHDQHLTPSRLTVEDIFPQEVIGKVKV
jgi:4,5-dihydroxyphthalate decarboxylase